jgi:hypothetical protein
MFFSIQKKKNQISKKNENVSRMYARIVKKGCTSQEWNLNVEECIKVLKHNYKDSEHCLDLTKDGFLRKEVYRADECIKLYMNDHLVAFVFFFTTHIPSALYITLIVSVVKGYGSILLDYVRTSHIYDNQYIALRATLQSVCFYVKKGFKVFDFLNLESYISGTTNDSLTDLIRLYSRDMEKLSMVQQQIVDLGWIPDDSGEFPLIVRRCVTESIPRRHSKRLQNIL